VTTDVGDQPEATWEEGWSGHEQAQLHRLAKLPLAEKLRWLEEAHDLVRHLSAQKKRAPSGPGGSFDSPR